MHSVGDGRTVAEALAAFHADQGLPADGGNAAKCWAVRLGPLALPLPNFGWRRRALPVHDLHHVLTGYPCTPVGEFEMAAWEFAAGRYPHAAATAFCLPLIGLGALFAPRRSYRAFVRGRSSRTLYVEGVDARVLGTPVAQLRQATVAAPRAGTTTDLAAWIGLAVVSLGWTLLPVALLAVVLQGIA